jgi:hypothetical protein
VPGEGRLKKALKTANCAYDHAIRQRLQAKFSQISPHWVFFFPAPGGGVGGGVGGWGGVSERRRAGARSYGRMAGDEAIHGPF